MGLIIQRYHLILCSFLWLCCINAVCSQTIQSMLVRSDIRFRYATTEVTCVMRNDLTTPRELAFEVTLPKEAYISNFTMEIEGKEYPGQVKEKGAAREQYNTALQSGHSGGLVEQSVRHSNKFDVSVNVAAGSNVTFRLMYEELLRRRFGVYEHAVHINPMAANILDFTLEVFVQDRNEIIKIRTPEMRSDIINNALEERNNPLTIISHPTPVSAHVLYHPTPEELRQKGEGWFVVQYDVNSTRAGGDLMVVDGYFIHFFVPDDDLSPLPLDIVFVLDISGSMSGTKIRQLREAMLVILEDLREKDRFAILLFDGNVQSWRNEMLIATSSNIKSAQAYVKTIEARGSTDIHQALVRGLTILENAGFQSGRVPMIFFLTDGEPTAGVTQLPEILTSVKRRNEAEVSIYSLAFGNGADYTFLQKVSAQNKGFARKIYEASDAASQVSGLYSEISTVVLRNLTVTYHPTSSDNCNPTDVPADLTPVDVTRGGQPTVFGKFDFVAIGRFLPRPPWPIPRPKMTLPPMTTPPEPTGGSAASQDDCTGPGEAGLQLVVSGQGNSGQINLILIESSLDSLTLAGDNPFWSTPRDLGQMTERAWAYLTIKQLLEERLGAGDDSELQARILQMSLKYNFVTPLTSMVVTRPQDVSNKAEEQETYFGDGDGEGPRSDSVSMRGYHTPSFKRISQSSMSRKYHHTPSGQGISHSRKPSGYGGPNYFDNTDLNYGFGGIGVAGRFPLHHLREPYRSNSKAAQAPVVVPLVRATVPTTKTTVKPTVPSTTTVVKPTCAKNSEVKVKYIIGTINTASQSRTICLEPSPKGKRPGGNYAVFTTKKNGPSHSSKRKGGICKRGKRCSLSADQSPANQTQSLTVLLQGQKLTSPMLMTLKGAPLSLAVDEAGRLVLTEQGQPPLSAAGYSANASGDGSWVVLQQEGLTVAVRVLGSDCRETVVAVEVALASPPAPGTPGQAGLSGVLGPFFQSQDTDLTVRTTAKDKRGKPRRKPNKGQRTEYGSTVSQSCLAAGFPAEVSRVLSSYLLKKLGRL